MRVLIFADYDEGKLKPVTARLVGAVKQIDADFAIDILVAGDGVNDIAKQAAKLAGVNKVLLAHDIALKNKTAESLCDMLVKITKPYSHFFIASNSLGKNILGRLAAKLDLVPISDIIKIHSPKKFDRPIYAGNAIKTISTEQDKILASIRVSAFEPVEQGNEAKVEQIEFGKVNALVEVLNEKRNTNNMVDLSSAAIVVAGGQAFECKENFEMLYQLGEVLGAAVGATRAAVDLGFAPNEMQIGQSGKIIAPELYIAVGISGALQHLAGISGAKKIIAINNDAEAPMMKFADIALVGDLKAILPELIKKLAS